jgi:hypothetical protein
MVNLNQNKMEIEMFLVGCLLVSLPTAAFCTTLIEEGKIIKAMAYLLGFMFGLFVLVMFENIVTPDKSDIKGKYKQIEGTNVYRKIN